MQDSNFIRKFGTVLALIIVAFVTFFAKGQTTCPGPGANELTSHPTGVLMPSDIQIPQVIPVSGNAIYVTNGTTSQNPIGDENDPFDLNQMVHFVNTTNPVWPSTAWIVNFKEGIYTFENEHVISMPVIFQPATTGAVVWFEGTREVVGQWVNQSFNKWNISTLVNNEIVYEYGLNQGVVCDDLLKINNNGVIETIAPMSHYGEILLVDNVPYWQVSDKLKLSPGTFYINRTNHVLWVMFLPDANPNDSTVKMSTVSRAFHFLPGTEQSAVRGLGFRYFAEGGMTIKSNEMTIVKNTFAWNGSAGLTLYDDDQKYRAPLIPEKEFGKSNVVKNNNFIANGLNGLRANRQDNFTLQDNVFLHNNVERYSPKYKAAAIKITGSHFSEICGNIFEENFASGIWLDVSCQNTTIYSNILRNNTLVGTDTALLALDSTLNDSSFGAHLELSDLIEFAFNTIDGNGSAGVYISETSRCRVYNNTIVNTAVNAVRVRDGSRRLIDVDNYHEEPVTHVDKLRKEEQMYGITWDTWDNIIVNNIMHTTRSDADVPRRVLFANAGLVTGYDLPLAVVGYATDGSPILEESCIELMVMTMQNNLYWQTVDSPEGLIKWQYSGLPIYPTVYEFATYNPGYGVQSVDFYGGNVNVFIDIDSYDYRLSDDSEAWGLDMAIPNGLAGNEAVGYVGSQGN